MSYAMHHAERTQHEADVEERVAEALEERDTYLKPTQSLIDAITAAAKTWARAYPSDAPTTDGAGLLETADLQTLVEDHVRDCLVGLRDAVRDTLGKRAWFADSVRENLQ